METGGRRRRKREGPALAALTFGAMAVLAALTLGAVAGIDECAYGLFLLLGLGAIVGRAELAEVNRRFGIAIFGGTGEGFARFWRALWLIWGAVAVTACSIALLSSAIRAVT